MNENLNRDDNYGNYSPGMKTLVRSFHVTFFILAAIIMGMFIWLFTFGGFFIVQPQETVLVLRFGKLIGRYSEDWHWIYPYPVDEIIRIPTNKLKLTTFAFWKKEKKMPGGAPQPQGGPLVPGKDGYLLTGDANILLTQWEITYHISQPSIYYRRCLCPQDPKQDDPVIFSLDMRKLGTRGPQTLLRTVLENTIIKITGTEKIEDALWKDSIDYMDKVRQMYIKTIADLNIGIEIDEVMLRGKAVPTKAKAAFDDVINAEQESSTKKKEARKKAVKLENEALKEKSRIITEAEAYKKRTVESVKAEEISFKKILEEYKKNSDIVLLTLYNEMVADVIMTIKNKFIIRNSPSALQEVRLKINPEPKTPKKPKKEKKK